MDTQKRSESRLRLTVADFKCLAFIFLAIAIVFWDVFSLQMAFLSGDHLIQHYPWAKFLQDHIRQFKLPWWTHQLQCGFPLLAEGQIGAFYPINILFLAILPLKWAYNYEVLFHFFLGACFVYVYVRSLKVSPEGSFLAALIFLFGSAEGGFFYNITSQRVSIWFPLALWVIEKLIEKPSFRLASLLAIIHSLQIVAGYQQIALYALLFAALYFLLRISTFKDKTMKTNRLRALSYFGISFLLCLAMTSIQWFPFLQLSAYSSRVEATESLAYLGSLPPFFLMTLLFPDWTGFWGGGGGLYVGVLGFFFALTCLLSGNKSQEEKLWWIIFMVATLLALGKYSPLYILIVKLFRIYYFRIPSKFLFFASTALAVLAGFGFDKFLKTEKDSESNRRTAVVLWGFFILIVTTLSISHWAGIYFKEPILDLLKNYIANHIFGQPYHPHSLDIYYGKLLSRYEFFLQLTSFRARQTFWPIVMFVIQMSAAHFLLKEKGKRYVLPALLAFVFIDLLFYVHQNTRRDLVSFDRVEIKSKLVDRILQDKEIFRIHEFNTKPLEPDIFPMRRNQNMVLGLDDIGIYSPLAFSSYKKFLGQFGGVDDSFYETKGSLEWLKERRTILDQLNVKYVLSSEQLTAAGLESVGEEKGIWLYQNRSVWPRAFYAKELKHWPPLERPHPVKIMRLGEGDSIFGHENHESGFVVISEQNYPGWKYRQGKWSGEPVSLGVAFMAIPIHEKQASIRLYFEPRHKQLLVLVSLTTLLLALLALIRADRSFS